MQLGRFAPSAARQAYQCRAFGVNALARRSGRFANPLLPPSPKTFATLLFVLARQMSRFFASSLLGLLGLPWTGCADLNGQSAQEAIEPPRSDIRLLWTTPDPQTAHPIDRPVTLCFSGYLSPDSIRPGSASLSSGSRNYDSRLEFDLADWRDQAPNEKRCAGSILRVFLPEDLAPDTRYRLRLVDRLQDWQGLTLSSEGDPRWIQQGESRVLVIEFQSASAAPKAKSPAPQPLSFRELFEKDAIFGPQNASCSCHRQLPGFNLQDPEALYQQLRYQEHSSGQPWVRPGFASWSYLIFKVLRESEGHALPGVFGEPMPPKTPIKTKELRQLAQWINDGAQY